MRVHETWCKPNKCCCMLSSTNKRNIYFSWTQRSVVSKPLFEKVFFQDKRFFQNCLRQFCLKGKYCFQTSAWGSGFEKEVLFPSLCLEHFFWRKVLFPNLCLGQFFPKRSAFYKDLFRTVLFEREMLFPKLCLGQCFCKRSAVSKLLLGAVFLKKKCYFQTCAWGSFFQEKCFFQSSV